MPQKAIKSPIGVKIGPEMGKYGGEKVVENGRLRAIFNEPAPILINICCKNTSRFSIRYNRAHTPLDYKTDGRNPSLFSIASPIHARSQALKHPVPCSPFPTLGGPSSLKTMHPEPVEGSATAAVAQLIEHQTTPAHKTPNAVLD